MTERVGKAWATRSAATLARRLRREHAALALAHLASDAAVRLPPADLSAAEHECLRQVMLDVGMAKLDHWALDTLNGKPCQHHGEALDRAAHSLTPEEHRDHCYVKQRGDVARHCAVPPTDLGMNFHSQSEIIGRLDTLGTMVASLQLGQFHSATSAISSLNPAATVFTPAVVATADRQGPDA